MKEKVALASSLCKNYPIGDLTIEASKNLNLEVMKAAKKSVVNAIYSV